MDPGLSTHSEGLPGSFAARLGSRRDLVLLGSTGSIGTQAADIVRRNPDRFRLVALAAGGSNPELLASQAIEFGVEVVAVASERAVTAVHEALQAKASEAAQPVPKLLAGAAAVAEVAAWQSDVVLNAVTGAVGLAATLATLDAGRLLALANKESLIMGGHLVTDRAAPGQIVPVDSEHSAIAQSLRSGRADEVRKLVVTASGGPFLHWTRDQMASATPAQALAHPTWNMGPVITINSATLVNKGLEVIEAHLLFDIGLDDIEVVVHRQSVIHSMVEFTDGSTIAQASPPDMRIPIAHALAWPERVADAARPVDWTTAHTWTFEPLDNEAFPAVGLAREAARRAGTTPAVYNAANEECVAAFTNGGIPFGGIVDAIARVVSEHGSSGPRIAGLDDVLAADNWARVRARELTQAGAR
ncbi:MAG TPA: 1-deoxy-D-xylulose-5-phosphate reductoisomerase [Streptosporangiaceae bacterium]|nr:1-deoxy-D-xylulose-5-phosphate reductoisomerase [Streptosporangiaceae bacterium]